jgi:hypothetical protein
MEDHRTWPNSLLFWTLETKCEHGSIGGTIQPIVQSPHYNQRVQLWRETIFNTASSYMRSLPCGVTTGRRGSKAGDQALRNYRGGPAVPAMRAAGHRLWPVQPQKDGADKLLGRVTASYALGYPDRILDAGSGLKGGLGTGATGWHFTRSRSLERVAIRHVTLSF